MRLRESIRVATQQYQDPRVASQDGYRVLGPSFPGMGQHWVNVALLMTRELDPDRPTMLTYATIHGRLTLTGAGFATVVAPGGEPPSWPAGPDAWHFHAGSIEDESFRDGMSPLPAGTRLAVLHAWVWTDNPGGVFARDNWALPYLQNGMTVPPLPDPDAARSLAAVTSEGREYYANRWRAAGRDSTVVRQLLDDHARLVGNVRRTPMTPLRQTEALAQLWQDLCRRAGGCGGHP